jgi:multiple sugar transport system ATP-binding protein
MADRIVVMRDGRILQVGTPTELYEHPVDIFTARFIGSPSMNLLPARLEAGQITMAGATNAPAMPPGARPSGSEILVGVRPHNLVVGQTEGNNGMTIAGTVNAVEPLGAETLVHVEIGASEIIATAPGKLIPKVGSTVSATAATGSLHLFDAGSEQALGRV